jgi:hypothetical protein
MAFYLMTYKFTSFDAMAIALFIITIADYFVRSELLGDVGIIMIFLWVIYRKVLKGDIGG